MMTVRTREPLRSAWQGCGGDGGQHQQVTVAVGRSLRPDSLSLSLPLSSLLLDRAPLAFLLSLAPRLCLRLLRSLLSSWVALLLASYREQGITWDWPSHGPTDGHVGRLDRAGVHRQLYYLPPRSPLGSGAGCYRPHAAFTRPVAALVLCILNSPQCPQAL
jgi:hypothetical protein